VRKAVGQHISITVFSDSQKRIIPFTNDIDLLDARLSGLENLDLTRGGTGLKLAIQETVQYYKARSGSVKGNILIFTDAENNADFGVVNIQEDINIAIVGVGTLNGATIPIRDKRGNFKGNKEYKGKEVITKLDEETLRSLGKKIKNYKYWTASSYSLPTDKVIDFFGIKSSEQEKKDNIRIRPVLANYIMIPAVVILIISFILKSFKSFIVPLMVIVSLNAYSQEKAKPKKEKSKTVLELEKKFKSGSISQLEKRKLAKELLKEKFSKESASLYREVIDTGVTDSNKEDFFNWGASELMNGKINAGLNIYKELYEYLKANAPESELMEDTKKNILKALIQDQKQKNQKKKQDKQKKKNKKDKKNKKKDSKKGKEKSKDGSKSDKKDKDGKDSKDDSKPEENKDKSGKNKSKDDKDKNKNKEKNDKKNDQQKNDKQSKRKEKLPALLKQLMNDDNQLQRKVIDAATTKRAQGDKKDW
jgi:Ca-activated chloride channel family protein